MISNSFDKVEYIIVIFSDDVITLTDSDVVCQAQTAYFMWAKSNANEKNPLLSLMTRMQSNPRYKLLQISFLFFLVVANCNANCYWLLAHCSQWKPLLFFHRDSRLYLSQHGRFHAVSVETVPHEMRKPSTCRETWANLMHDKLWVKWTSSIGKIFGSQ